MSISISVIVPNYNADATIGICLKALYSSGHQPFEVIVVDDCSTDKSAEVISRFPCRLIRLLRHSGASTARNTGARESSGELLFFIDADCVVQEDTLARAAAAYEENRACVIGGSYTPLAYDDTFFSTFQSIFINYSELKYREPDYIASHAMVMSREIFMQSGGFPEDFMPILEDVEFSHRLKRFGVRLIMDDGILVRHIFYYDIGKSLRNAVKKARYWIAYSLANKDLANDSGTASVELKFAVFFSCLTWFFLLCFFISPNAVFIASATALLIFNLAISRGLVRAFFNAKGLLFGIGASGYYSFIYPLAVAAGGAAGMLRYLRNRE
jgi:glycosyltransferase involved in cell wall biosynthesis